ncbi:hypothetical protein BCR44DRAFT_1424069 [Catenaria anguillulae PL171]|uniref:Cation-transporting P-type ATPase C-terminal domain-containing protein n=1 Tax=Catenaria anguillulae PL171 TaxID=765915 RepID=A0A1Y2I3Y8_9FUNG|nr:hypothetical protein BCR44DRAFT_1424069 [Catenaria anguillulae PL171]
MVAYGRGKGIVVTTGKRTEIGKIAEAVMDGSKQVQLTPLERTMRNFMFVCLLVAILLGMVVFWVNKWNISDTQVLLYAIVTTVAMALGVSTMAKEKAVVRKTLTEGRMSVLPLGRDHCGLAMDVLKPFLDLCGMCNTCTVSLDAEKCQGTGDTTEIALAVVAHRHGHAKEQLIGQSHTFFAEYPFDSTIKRMSVLYRETFGDNDVIMYSKGALESVLPRCTAYLDKDGVTAVSMNKEYEASVHDKALAMATQGLRVLCIAIRRFTASELMDDKQALDNLKEADKRDVNETKLVLLGLTKGAIADCHQAGIVVHVITGDHPATAAAIARQIGVLPASATAGSDQERKLVMTSTQFDPMTDEQLDALAELPLVIARCSPETKVKMIQALHRRDRYVAMTGDGVNDAPAIAYADVGIAMGMGGADVTKQAADISLTDDNIATIVVALIIGLVFHDGLGQPIFPMSAIQILWLNLVTSSPIALALAMEPASRELMKVKPRDRGVFTWEFIADTGILGCIMGGLTLLTFCLVAFIHAETPLNLLIPPPGQTATTRGVGFVTLCALLLVHGINCRSARRSLFHYDWAEAKILLWAIAIGAVFVVPLPYIPVINTNVIYHSAFTYEWGYIAASCVVFMIVAEFYKLVKRSVLPAEWVLINNGGEYELVETKEGADQVTTNA